MQSPAIQIILRNISFVIATACTLGSVTARAQTGVLVQDFKTELEAHAQTVKQIAQYAKQAQQYVTQVQQYEQMFTQVQNLGQDFHFFPPTMEEIAAGPVIAAKCGTGSSNVAGNILNSVTSLLNQSITKSQQAICAQIVTTQVNKYNSTVQMLNTMNKNIGPLQSLADQASTFTNMGQATTAETEATSYVAQMESARNSWEATVKADDATLSSLNDMQSTLAANAMNAKPDMGGEAVQAAVLTAAFTYHPSL